MDLGNSKLFKIIRPSYHPLDTPRLYGIIYYKSFLLKSSFSLFLSNSQNFRKFNRTNFLDITHKEHKLQWCTIDLLKPYLHQDLFCTTVDVILWPVVQKNLLIAFFLWNAEKKINLKNKTPLHISKCHSLLIILNYLQNKHRGK